MARRYDSRTTIFSPEGRLYQVEYAMEAISHAGAALAILANDGIVLAAEKKVTSKLLDNMSHSTEKIYKLNSNVACAVAGLTADANILINNARTYAERYRFSYNEDMPLQQLVNAICNLKQGYTQYGGLRPFGVSFLYAGYDKYYGFQLYHSDPSGNYSGWKAYCVGANNASAQSILKQEYKEDEELSLEDAIKLSIKVLVKTMDSTSLSSEKLEFATLKLNKDNQVVYHLYKPEEVDELLKAHKEMVEETKMDE